MQVVALAQNQMSDHASLTAKLREIDENLVKLKVERMEIVSKLSYIALVNAMREIGEQSLARLENEMNDSGLTGVKACYFTNTTLVAWKASLSYNFFPKTASLLPEYGPSRMTEEEARALFAKIADAIREDLAAMKRF